MENLEAEKEFYTVNGTRYTVAHDAHDQYGDGHTVYRGFVGTCLRGLVHVSRAEIVYAQESG